MSIYFIIKGGKKVAKNQSTYTLKIDAELGNLQKTLNEAKNSLSGFLASGNAPKGLEKAFEKINVLLGQISDKTGKPLDLKGLTGAGKDLATVEENFRAIIRLLGDFNDLSDDIKLSFLSVEEQKKIIAVTNALKAYGDAATESAKKVKQLESAQKALQKNENNFNKATKKVSGLQSKKTSKEAELAGARGKLAAVQGVESADPEKIAQYQAKVVKLEADLTNLNKELAEANQELTASQKAYDASAKSVKALTNEADRAGKESLHKLKEQAKELGVSLDGLNGHNAAKQIEILTARLEDFKTESLKGAEPAFKAIVNGCQKAEQAVDGLGQEVEDASISLQKMDEAAAQRDAFEAKIKSFLGLQGAAQLMRAALRDAIQTITELDATMTEMAVVTDLGVSDYWNQLPQYTARANKLGLAINDVYKADTLFYQQGLKTNEVVEISTETMKMARIAGLDTAEATDRMTAALRGFNMELNEASAQKVSDVYSELAAITAADVEEISSAMTKTASIASSAGMEFETTAAFLAQIVETTRESAETAGTAMKTVIARFQELKKDPSEIGEVDGEIVDANKIETALRSVGVALRDSSGQFRELDDVFLELSSKWDGLDKNTQRYIATIAAGSRQQSRFIAMMSDYGRTQELVTAANNSAGASAKQFEKTQESLSAKMEKLKNTWHEFTMGIMNSDLIKVGVDILTKFLEIINKATNGLGDKGFGGALMKIAGVFAIFKMGMKIFNKFETPIMSLFKKVTEWAGVEGFKAGKTYTEAAERGAQSVANNKSGNENNNEADDKNSNNENQSPKKPLEKSLTEITGIDDIKEGLNKKKNKRNEILANKNQQAIARRKQANSKYTEALTKQAEAQKQGEEQYKKAIEETKRARQECENVEREYQSRLELTEDEQKQITEAGKEGWAQVGKGIGAASQALTGIGMSMSMIGGLLSSLGLESVGSAISDIGQAITMVGGALMIIPPILTLISSHPFVAIIVGILAAILALTVGIISAINNSSAEAKLERAAENAEAAGEAAEKASQAYENLSNSLDDLGTKYDALDDLRRGTEEWNKTVQDVNDSVLELINNYPELAGFIESDGGVLTLDVNSDNVQKVLRDAKKAEVSAQGAALGAKMTVEQAKREVELNQIDPDTFDAFKTEKGAGAGFLAGLGIVGMGAGIGAGAGAGIGALAGAVLTGGLGIPVTVAGGAGAGAGIGAGIGAMIGAIASLPAAITTGIKTKEETELRNETNRNNFKEIAQAFANGEISTNLDDAAKWIEDQGYAVGDAAHEMASQLLANSEEIAEYGQSLNAMDAANKAYYQAMATNAQQLIDLGKYSEKEVGAMTEVVDEELLASYKQQYKDDLTERAGTSESDEYKQAKKDFAKEVYGENARVDGNKILDEKGEVIREFTDDDAFINEMAAAKATKKAAEAMEKIPEIIKDNMTTIIENAESAFSNIADRGKAAETLEKAFSGKDLTDEELNVFKQIMGSETKDENGNVDYAGIDKLWENMTLEQMRVYGDITDLKDTEGIKKAKEAYEDTFVEIAKAQDKAFEKAKLAAEELGIELSSKLTSGAAQGWTNLLSDIFPDGSQEEAQALNNAFNTLIEGKTAEEAEAIMSQIGAIDKMDAGAWDNLAYTLYDLGLVTSYTDSSLQSFISQAKLATNAIEKIDFSSFNNQINQTIKLLEKTKEGARKYSEEDYKSFMSANPALKEDFIQIGDEFVYLGNSMETLTDAIQKNTVSKLEEANRLLEAQVGMSTLLQDAAAITTNAAERGLREWLVDAVQSFASSGYDVADLGIMGLSLDTDFSQLDKETLQKMVGEVQSFKGRKGELEEQQKKQMRDANVAAYTLNDTAFNAKMGYQGGEWADEHRDALRIQAIDAGVGDVILQSYANASKQYEDMMKKYEGMSFEEAEAAMSDSDKVILDNFKLVSQNMVDMIHTAEENEEEKKELDALSPLAEKVTSAIEKQRQSTIDKLSDVNDSINSANNLLVSKIQEQIDANRQERENQNMKDNLSNMYAQQAYLGMDTSGANALSMVDNDKAIEQAEQEYRDAMIDQAIQKLQDANEQAAQQRERQINLLQQQLDYEMETGQIADQAAQIVRESIDQVAAGQDVSQTKLNEYMQSSLDSLGGMEKTQAKNEWIGLINQAIQNADASKAENNSGTEISGNTLENSGTSDGGTLGGANLANQKTMSSAISTAEKQILEKQYTGKDDALKDSVVAGALESYINAGGSEEDFWAKMEEEYIKAEKITNAKLTTKGNNLDFNDLNKGKDDVGPVNVGGSDLRLMFRKGSDDVATRAKKDGLQSGEFFKYNGAYYLYQHDNAYQILSGKRDYDDFTSKIKFKTGGLADFTGPAWLDGTPSKPEYVLNSAQTERFFSLVDILEGIDKKDSSNKSSGDNYFDINISVEKLENDYDVEQVAEKIRKMIYDDATYRNVNAINHIR